MHCQRRRLGRAVSETHVPARQRAGEMPTRRAKVSEIAVSSGPATFDVPSLQRGYYTVEVTASGLCISIR